MQPEQIEEEIKVDYPGLLLLVWGDDESGDLTITGSCADVDTIHRIKMEKHIPTDCKLVLMSRDFDVDHARNIYRFN